MQTDMLHTVNVTEETQVLVNINTMIDDLYSALQKYHEKFERNVTDTQMDDVKDNEWRMEMDDLLEGIKDYVRSKIQEAVKHNLDEMRYSI